MYFGEYSSKLDEKGRVSVPRHFRVRMEAHSHIKWYMTRGFDNCIALYPQSSWDAIVSHMSQYSTMNAKALDFRRLLFGSVTETQVDGQGRLTIPQYLREYGGIENDREAVMIGVNDHLEIWGKKAWAAFQQSNLADIKEMASELFQVEDAAVAAHPQEGNDDGA